MNKNVIPINYLELLAVFLGLKSFAKNVTHCNILLRVDNTTAISNVNRMGGIQFPHLNDLRSGNGVKEKTFGSSLLTLIEVANQESRKVYPDTEWELSKTTFQTIVKKFGRPDIPSCSKLS